MLSNSLVLDHPFALGDQVIALISYREKYESRLDKLWPEKERTYEIIGIVEERMILNGDEKARVGLQLKGLPHYRYFNAEKFEIV